VIRDLRNFAEIIEVIDLMEAAFRRSKWAAIPGAGINREEARRRLVNARDRHGINKIGGTFFMVAENKGQLQGFMVGEVDRVYGVGTLPQVMDIYLYARSAADGADPMDWMRLVKAYLDWAVTIPKVAQILLSQTDFIEGEHQDQIRRLYAHMGFRQSGTLYERGATA